MPLLWAILANLLLFSLIAWALWHLQRHWRRQYLASLDHCGWVETGPSFYDPPDNGCEEITDPDPRIANIINRGR